MKRVIVATIGVAATAAGLLMCGGTTGFENQPSNVAGGLDGGADGTLGDDGSLYTGEFDAEIPWVDVYLPDVHTVPVEGGLPDCPPFIPVLLSKTADGGTSVTRVPASRFATTELPAIWIDDAGAEGFAPDGSVCATYPWLGTTDANQCVVRAFNIPDTQAPLLPPCSWALDAGVAVAGPNTNESRFDNCIALYQCMMQTLCFTTDVSQCYCGPGISNGDPSCITNPTGLCKDKEISALEISTAGGSSQVYSQIFGVFTEADQTFPGWSGAWLNWLMNLLVKTATCSPFDAGSQGDE